MNLIFRKLCLIAAGALSCWPAFGQATIEGPEKVAPYRFIDHKMAGAWEATLWEIEPAKDVDSRYGEDQLTVSWVAPPGTYTVRVVGINFTTKKAVRASKVVVIEGVTPPNPPLPPVPPIPVPGEKQQVAFFLESADLLKLTKAQRYVGSLVFRQALAARGHLFLRVFDDDTAVPAEFAPWVQAAAGKQPPLLLTAPIEGGTVQARALPPDEAAALKAIDGSGKRSN